MGDGEKRGGEGKHTHTSDQQQRARHQQRLGRQLPDGEVARHGRRGDDGAELLRHCDGGQHHLPIPSHWDVRIDDLRGEG